MVKIIVPYLFEEEIQRLQDAIWKLPVEFQQDVGRIGSDLMYQKMWNECLMDDVFIMHADMLPLKDDFTNKWWDDLLSYVERYPEAGMLGCKLLYPAKSDNDKYYIQCAGGIFTEDGKPDHLGSGLEIFSGKQFKNLEEDNGQYDSVREVAWTTFGGLYIRREVLLDVGDFDPGYEWTYNRDVDYCLEARKKGWKIYQVPVPLLHFESKDNKRLMQQNQELNAKWGRNFKRLLQKWSGSDLYKTINKEVV